METALAIAAEKKVRIVTNAGGLNPARLAYAYHSTRFGFAEVGRELSRCIRGQTPPSNRGRVRACSVFDWFC
jgi:hypothetical protein